MTEKNNTLIFMRQKQDLHFYETKTNLSMTEKNNTLIFMRQKQTSL